MAATSALLGEYEDWAPPVAPERRGSQRRRCRAFSLRGGSSAAGWRHVASPRHTLGGYTLSVTSTKVTLVV